MVGLHLLCRMAPEVGLGMKNVSLHFSSYSTILMTGGGLALQLFWKETFQTYSLWSNSQNKYFIPFCIFKIQLKIRGVRMYDRG